MPSATIPPPEQTLANNTHYKATPRLPPLIPPGPHTNGYDPNNRPPSPVAPEFSPITPPSRPVLPATYPTQLPPPPEAHVGVKKEEDQCVKPAAPATAPTEFIPQPPPQPFSSEDSTDAIALRAAISSLQFQRKKAQDDIRELERIRKKALKEPDLFKTELLAERMKEEKPGAGNWQSVILDQVDGSDDDEEAVLGASREDEQEVKQEPNGDEVEMLDGHSSSSNSKSASPKKDSPPFGRIPGPQNVVRMPYINWDKYKISGEALDQLHEQQRKWPGSFAYGDKGREFTVAAPYSPWLDRIDTQAQAWDGSRNDSVATPGTAITPGSISEHPMETRRRQTHQ